MDNPVTRRSLEAKLHPLGHLSAHLQFGVQRFRAPPGTRTRNLRIKSPLLCQIELEAHPAGQPSLSRGSAGQKRVTEGT